MASLFCLILQLFADMGTLVEAQGELLDNIETNVSDGSHLREKLSFGGF